MENAKEVAPEIIQPILHLQSGWKILAAKKGALCSYRNLFLFVRGLISDCPIMAILLRPLALTPLLSICSSSVSICVSGCPPLF